MANGNMLINAEKVSKKFSRSLGYSIQHGLQDITTDLLGLSSHPDKLRKDEFWAVDDISFNLKKGETLGIIGPNGSGKSTILKMLSGIFMPDKGKIEINGRVGSLIEIGAGFHPLLNGKENIYVNGAVLRMSKKEIDNKFDSIVDFAEIGDFLDSPIKFYSSGMHVRLGFAIAIHSEPDILLIDEVLAVGDKEFQLKCYQKMHEIKKKGTTIILVSHNEQRIREQTEKCLYIRNGKMKFLGQSSTGLGLYLREMLEERARKAVKPTQQNIQATKKAQILSLKFFDREEKEISFIESNQELNILLECIAYEKLNNPVFGINFNTDIGLICSANNEYENVKLGELPPGKSKIKINIPYCHLPANNYSCDVIIAEEKTANVIDWHHGNYNIIVGKPKNARGSIKIPTKWEIERS